MRTLSFFVAGALLVVAPIARAQDAAPIVVSPVAPAPDAAPQSGYETLVAATKLMVAGENGSPTSPQKLAPVENLRRQRAAVKRNALALKLLREALQMPITIPAVRNENDVNSSFPLNGGAREMARLLRQESDVRLADGAAAGALDSRLTALELGASITRGGTVINALVGSAIEAIARHEFETVAVKLDAAQIRAALPRLRAVNSRRATYAETMREEKAVVVRFTLSNSKGLFDSKSEETVRKFLTAQSLEEAKISEEEAREILALTPEILSAQIGAIFDAIIARDELPYERALRVELPPTPNAFVRVATEYWRNPKFSNRFFYERNRTAQLLFEGALELRAIKLESGAYPATFAAPLDPFGDNEPLVYERRANSYVLYSIGPDGLDNGGKSFAPTRQIFDPESGTMQTSPVRAAQADTKGDIVAPVF